MHGWWFVWFAIQDSYSSDDSIVWTVLISPVFGSFNAVEDQERHLILRILVQPVLHGSGSDANLDEVTSLILPNDELV